LHLNFEGFYTCKNALFEVFDEDFKLKKTILKITRIRAKEKNYFKKLPRKVAIKFKEETRS
jgi:hypothetical protein